VKEIDNKIKKKIGESDKRLATQSVFLFSQNKLLNRGKPFPMQKLRLTSCTTNTKTSKMRCSTCTLLTLSPSDDSLCDYASNMNIIELENIKTIKLQWED
jgi:hypothetical protein